MLDKGFMRGDTREHEGEYKYALSCFPSPRKCFWEREQQKRSEQNSDLIATDEEEVDGNDDDNSNEIDNNHSNDSKADHINDDHDDDNKAVMTQLPRFSWGKNEEIFVENFMPGKAWLMLRK